jgi:hypothetical protein
MKKRRNFTPIELIQLWADYQAGGVSGTQLRIRPNGNGGLTGQSLTLAASEYIQSVRTFRKAKPFLLWVYAPSASQCDGRGGGDITKIENAYPGELWPRMLADAWIMFLLGYPKPLVAGTVINQFMKDLVTKMRATPFVFGGTEIEDDAPIPDGAKKVGDTWVMPVGAK